MSSEDPIHKLNDADDSSNNKDAAGESGDEEGSRNSLNILLDLMPNSEKKKKNKKAKERPVIRRMTRAFAKKKGSDDESVNSTTSSTPEATSELPAQTTKNLEKVASVIASAETDINGIPSDVLKGGGDCERVVDDKGEEHDEETVKYSILNRIPSISELDIAVVNNQMHDMEVSPEKGSGSLDSTLESKSLSPEQSSTDVDVTVNQSENADEKSSSETASTYNSVLKAAHVIVDSISESSNSKATDSILNSPPQSHSESIDEKTPKVDSDLKVEPKSEQLNESMDISDDEQETAPDKSAETQDKVEVKVEDKSMETQAKVDVKVEESSSQLKSVTQPQSIINTLFNLANLSKSAPQPSVENKVIDTADISKILTTLAKVEGNAISTVSAPAVAHDVDSKPVFTNDIATKSDVTKNHQSDTESTTKSSSGYGTSEDAAKDTEMKAADDEEEKMLQPLQKSKRGVLGSDDEDENSTDSSTPCPSQTGTPKVGEGGSIFDAKAILDVVTRSGGIPFEVIQENIYKFDKKSTKSQKEFRRMVCDCSLTKDEVTRGIMGCEDDCLNRLLMIECGSRCPLGINNCSNRRFQKHQYANVEVFKTEKKGLGIRAKEHLAANQFVMEYVGEVLTPSEFKQRVKQYAKENNRHYYFMALRTDEIIDATLKGSPSRFINHSCDPNCETQKWTVGGELRVGFFTRRPVRCGEELTFDYQFERYGREAQKCYCEAPNCRGYIGGDKQADLKAMTSSSSSSSSSSAAPASSSTASSSSSASAASKATKFKKEMEERSRRDILEDLALQDDIEKLSEGLRNRDHTLLLARIMLRGEGSETRRKILEKIKLTTETACLRLFIDYHGLQLLWSWMVDEKDLEMRAALLEVLAILPIPNKTMLKDSKVMQVVHRWASEFSDRKEQLASETSKKTEGDADSSTFADEERRLDEVAKMAAKVLDEWSQLKEVFRIPRMEQQRRIKDEHEADRRYRDYTRRMKQSQPPPSSTSSYDRHDRDRHDRDRDRRSSPPRGGSPPSSSSSFNHRSSYSRNSFESDRPSPSSTSGGSAYDRRPSRPNINGFERKDVERVSRFDHNKRGQEIPCINTTWAGVPPGMSKQERRHQFAMEIQQRDEEEAKRRQQQAAAHAQMFPAPPPPPEDIYAGLPLQCAPNGAPLGYGPLSDGSLIPVQYDHQGMIIPFCPPGMVHIGNTPAPAPLVPAVSMSASFAAGPPVHHPMGFGPGPVVPTNAPFTPIPPHQQQQPPFNSFNGAQPIPRPMGPPNHQSMSAPMPITSTVPPTPAAPIPVINNASESFHHVIPDDIPLPPPSSSSSRGPHSPPPTAVLNGRSPSPPPSRIESLVTIPEKANNSNNNSRSSKSAKSSRRKSSGHHRHDRSSGSSDSESSSDTYSESDDGSSPSSRRRRKRRERSSHRSSNGSNSSKSKKRRRRSSSERRRRKHSKQQQQQSQQQQQQQQQHPLATVVSYNPAHPPNVTEGEPTHVYEQPPAKPNPYVQMHKLQRLSRQLHQFAATSAVFAVQHSDMNVDSSTSTAICFDQNLLHQQHQMASAGAIGSSNSACIPASAPIGADQYVAGAYGDVTASMVAPPMYLQPQHGVSAATMAPSGVSAPQPFDDMNCVDNAGVPVQLASDSSVAPTPAVVKPLRLPPNWKTATDDEGNVYYYHTLTRETQWEPPEWDPSMVVTPPPPPQPPIVTTLKTSSSSSRRGTTTAAADTSEVAKKIKELFRTKMSSYIVHCLGPFRKQSAKVGRITSNEDFKYLARKLTHAVLAKELKHCKQVEDLDCNENVKHKARDFIHKYMSKFGPVYKAGASSSGFNASPQQDDIH